MPKKILSHFLYALLLAACVAKPIPVSLTAIISTSPTKPPSLTATPQSTATGTVLPTIVTITKIPNATPTIYYSAPKDGGLDTTCRITIDLFFSFKQGFSSKAYHDLFIPASQYLADNVTPPEEARILLKLMPASQWWQENFPGKLIPGDILPEEANEYVYHVEFTYHYTASTTPVSTFPDGWTIHMVADGQNSCKIKSYGKG